MRRWGFLIALQLAVVLLTTSACSASPGRRRPTTRAAPQPRAVARSAPRPSPPASARGVERIGWAIQVGAFAEVANAERLAGRLETLGVDAFYFRRETGLFTVRFGNFPSREAAEREARRLQADGAIAEWFVSPPARGAAPPPNRPAPGPSASSRGDDDLGEVTARTAERFIGIPYRWGGNNVVEGMDCSGFVRAVYHLVGVAIPRTAAEQFRTGEAVDRRSLRDGDLVFFGDGRKVTHVGIYAGGDRFVHAPSRGQDIKVSSLGEPYFTRGWVGGRRFF